MPVVSGKEKELAGIMAVADLMLISARTAPKTGAEDDILTALVYGEEKDSLAEEMDKIANARKIEKFKRDAQNIRDSGVVVLIGARRIRNRGLDCGACGFGSCKEFMKAGTKHGLDFEGPICVFKAIDLGIALGSAVKTASILNVDNRILYHAGTAAKKLDYIPEASIIMGIPLSVTGKSIYFDRKWASDSILPQK